MSYDDYDDVQFSDDEVCSICGTPYYYTPRACDDCDVCVDCDPGYSDTE